MPEETDVSTAPAPEPSPLDLRIEAWFAEHFHNQPGISTSVGVYNRIHAAKEALKADLATFFKES